MKETGEAKARKPRRSKLAEEIAAVLASGGYIKIEVGTRRSESSRGISLRSYEERGLYTASKKLVRSLTEHQVERAAHLRLIDQQEFMDRPIRNCFDGSKRVVRLFGVKDAMEG